MSKITIKGATQSIALSDHARITSTALRAYDSVERTDGQGTNLDPSEFSNFEIIFKMAGKLGHHQQIDITKEVTGTQDQGKLAFTNGGMFSGNDNIEFTSGM